MSEQGKKGLHPLAWVGIGCGALLLVVVLAVGLGTAFVAKKAKDFVEEAEGNPVKAMAQMVIHANPDLEVVSSDDEAGAFTIRNVKTGEVVTVDWSDIEQGQLSFETDDGRTVIDADGDDGSGSVSISTPDGNVRYGAGTDLEELPEWIPLYPGTEPTSNYSASGTDGVNGAISFSTDDTPQQVLEHYQKVLEEAGYEVQLQTLNVGSQGPQGFLVGKNDAGRNVNVTAGAPDGKTEVTLHYQGES